MTRFPLVDKADELTKLVERIAKDTYEIIDALPESEQWDLQPKLRHEAVDMIASASEGSGGLDPRDAVWRLGQARGYLTALKSLVKLAHQTSKIKLDPEYMLHVEKAIAIIDEEVPAFPEKTKKWMETYYPTYDKEAKQ